MVLHHNAGEYVAAIFIEAPSIRRGFFILKKGVFTLVFTSPQPYLQHKPLRRC